MSDILGRTPAQPRTIYRGKRIRSAPSQDVLEVTDDRWTPQWFVDSLGIAFTLDVAASEANHKAPRWFDLAHNGLSQSWAGETCFCNPPYSHITPWVAKAHEEMAAGCKLIAMLLPATRTEQTWWQDYVEPYRDRRLGLETRFIRRRLRFECATGPIMPDVGSMGGKKNPRTAQPPFGNVLLLFTQPWLVARVEVRP